MQVSKSFRCEIKDMGVSAPQPILGGEAGIVVPLEVVFTNDQLIIDMTIDVEDDRPVCVKYQVQRAGGGDLSPISTEVVRGLPLRNFLIMACSTGAWMPTGDGDWQLPVGEPINMAVVDGLRASTRSRQPVTDERLEEFVREYRQHFAPGNMEEFARNRLNIGARQAGRLKKLAIERGLLESGE